MKLLTKELEKRLRNNGTLSKKHAGTDAEPDPVPVVKLFTPDGAATWLLTEVDPDEPDRAFGLCDLGMGFPELGYVSLTELRTVRGKFGLPVERDRWFKGSKPLSVYAREASNLGRINA